MADLRRLQPASSSAAGPGGPRAVVVGGYYRAGDGAGGVFYWDPMFVADDDGGIVIATSPRAGLGRWTRIYSGPLSVRWFGAKGDLSQDDGPAIRAAYAAAAAANVTLLVPGSKVRAGGSAASAGYLVRPPAGEPPAGQVAGVGLNLADPGVRVVGAGCSFGADDQVDRFPGQASKLVAGADGMVVLQLGNRDQEVRDIAVDGSVSVTGPGRAVAGVVLKNGIFSVLRRVAVGNCRTAFLFDNDAPGFPSGTGNNDSVRLEFCSARHSEVGIDMKTGPDNNALDFFAMDLSNNLSAMRLRGNYIRVWGGTFEGNGPPAGPPSGYAITVPDDSPSFGIRIYSPYFEGNTVGNVYFGARAGFCQYLSAMVSGAGDRLPGVGVPASNSIAEYVTGDPVNNLAEVQILNTWGRALRLSPGTTAPTSSVSCTGPTDDETLCLYGKGRGGVVLGHHGSVIQGLWTSDDNPSPPRDPSHAVPASTLPPGHSLSVAIAVSNNQSGSHPGLGDLALASYSRPLPPGVTISAVVESQDVGRITFVNNSDTSVVIPAGYVRVAVIVV